jgi:Zn-dependent protease
LALLGVLVHELGHALAARRLGIRVADIQMHLFFGMTRMAAPGSPREEILVGLAGPGANLTVAAALLPFILWKGWHLDPRPLSTLGVAFTTHAFLGALNLVPAFPMDGGRIFRALLALRFGPARATGAAVMLGRFLALGMLLVPLAFGWSGPLPVIPVIGIVVLVLGEAEARRAALREEERRVELMMRASTPAVRSGMVSPQPAQAEDLLKEPDDQK